MSGFDWQSYWRAAEEAVGRYRAEIDQAPVLPEVTAEEIRSHLDSTYWFDAPIAAGALVGDVARMMTEWDLHTPSPSYFGLYNPDVLPAAIAADALVAGFNPQLAAWSHAPGANEIERHVLRFVAKLLGYPSESFGGSFTAGGLEANHSAVIVALTRQFPAFRQAGILGCGGKPTIYVSAEAHHSFLKVAHACGLGRDAVREIAVDRSLRMSVGSLSRSIAEDRQAGCIPFMVVGTAGTTSAGAIDPLPEIASVCRQDSLWFHVDAAWGGGALVSPRLAPLLSGIEASDSVTFDAHKWLSVPMGAGMFICRDGQASIDAFATQTAYMPAKSQGPDPYNSTLQWSRRFIGLKAFMALSSMGRDGYARQIEHQAQMGDLLADALRSTGWDIVHHSPLAVVCFTHEDVRVGRATVREIVAALYRRRRAWVSPTTLSHHGDALRACITNYRTGPDHVRALVEELEMAREAAAQPTTSLPNSGA